MVGGAMEYPLLDGLGSVRQLTDASGTVILGRSYDAYGNVRLATGTGSSRLGYTGELQDSVSGLVYLRARHYYPALGRFLQRDSFGGFGQRPQSLNRYVYVQNSPLIFVDPSGHYSDEALFTHFGCRNWECVKAHFQPGGSHGGLWGWLDVLLKARDGDWVSTYAFFDLGSERVWSITTGRFITQGGKIKVADVRLNLQFCSYASDAFDNPWDEEQFAKMALTGFRMTGHFAFYNATGTSTCNQQYQDCRHEDCVTPVADGVAAGAATVAAGCALFVGPGSICAGAAGGVSTAASMVGAGTTFYYALNGQASEVDVFVAASTIIVGLGTKSNPYVSAGASIFQAAWDYFR